MLEILMETEKAVMVKNKYNQEVWLPKSVIAIKDSKVIAAEDWIKLDKHININTQEEDKPMEVEEIKKANKIINSINSIEVDYETETLEILATNGKKYKRNFYNSKKNGNYFYFRKNVFSFGENLEITWAGTYDKFSNNKKEIQETAKTKEATEKVNDYITHKEYDTIKACIENDIPVYLVGPAGSGKNHTLQQIATDLELDFYFTNAVQQEFKITGFIDAGGIYHETEFYKAFKDGGLFFLDEMDASIPEVLVLLNAAIANRYFDFPNGKIFAHPEFRIVAAGNTVGDGADEQYTGRLTLDQSSLDRFAVIEFDYDRNIELALAKGNKELVDFINELREECKAIGIRATFSYRAIISVEKLEKALPLEKVMVIAVVKGMDKDTIRTIRPVNVSNKYWKALKAIA